MRFNIKYKLFFTLLLTTLMAVASMLFIVRWSFERGFLEYINRVEQETHSRLVSNLASRYHEQGDWNFVRRNPRQLARMFHESMADSTRDRADDTGVPGEVEQRAEHARLKHRPPPAFARGPHPRRVCLLDKEQRTVGPCRHRVADLQLMEITSSGQPIGYLGISPRKKISHHHDLQFSERHHRFLFYLAFTILVVSAIVAFPASRQLVKPIKLLTEAMARLASGNYQTRVEVDSSDELGELSRDFNSLARTLESNEKARQQWIADISHELRTPLSVLRGEIEALQDGIREVNEERLESLHAQIMHLHRLVNDLYELSMSDIGALNYQLGETDLLSVLNQCIESFRDEYAARNIALTLECEADKLYMQADGERLLQLFSNLLSNSLRYTSDNGSLRVRIEGKRDAIKMAFEDSEPAVDESNLPRLFDRLFRVEDSRNRETGGTGLGLAICKNIVDAHGGDITASHSGLGGLKIEISFPRART